MFDIQGTYFETILVLAGTVLSIAIGVSPYNEMKEIQIKRTTGHMSFLPLIGIAFSSCCGILYGLLAGLKPMIFVNTVNALLTFYFISIYYQHSGALQNRVRYIVSLAVFLFVVILWYVWGIWRSQEPEISASAVTTLGNICLVALLFMFAAPLSQIKYVVDTRDSSTIPESLTFATFGNCIAWSLYGFGLGDFYVWGPNVAGLFFSSINIYLLRKYPKRPVLPTRL